MSLAVPARKISQEGRIRSAQNPAISDTLGWILVQKGETEDGLRLLREAHQGLQG